MGMLDLWLLLYILYPGLYNKAHIQDVYSAIRRKHKPVQSSDETEYNDIFRRNKFIIKI